VCAKYRQAVFVSSPIVKIKRQIAKVKVTPVSKSSEKTLAQIMCPKGGEHNRATMMFGRV
jgi:hypothetical protein